MERTVGGQRGAFWSSWGRSGIKPWMDVVTQRSKDEGKIQDISSEAQIGEESKEHQDTEEHLCTEVQWQTRPETRDLTRTLPAEPHSESFHFSFVLSWP